MMRDMFFTKTGNNLPARIKYCFIYDPNSKRWYWDAPNTFIAINAEEVPAKARAYVLLTM